MASHGSDCDCDACDPPPDLVLAVLAQIEDQPLAERIRILQTALAETLASH